jgi:histone H3/H4
VALIVKSEVGKKAGLRVSAEVYDALDKKVAWILAEAVKRAKANGRKTLMAADL